MIDKYLRNDKKFLIKKKEEDEIEKEYIKYLQRDFELENRMDVEIIDKEEEICIDKNYLMQEEDENKGNESFNKKEVKEIVSPKSKRGIFKEINELDDFDIYSDSKIEGENNFNSYKVDDQLENKYLDFENIYLNEGKIKKNIGSSDHEANELEINRVVGNKKDPDLPYNKSKKSLQRSIKDNQYENNEINNQGNFNFNSKNQINNSKVDQERLKKLSLDSPIEDINLISQKETILSENYDELDAIKSYEKNDFKLKKLQEKIEEKLKQEYEQKIKKKEKEIEMRTKSEFEDAISNLKDQLQKNLESEKEKLESDLQRKWDEKYQELLIDCKAKLRDDKEQKLASNMYNKLKPIVEKEIYKKEYNKIEEKIRTDLEEKFNKEIHTKKLEEIEKAKKKLEYYTKQKISEMESNLKSKCKEEVESELKKDIERKEKDIKINYMKKFNTFKINLEKQLKEDYEQKKKELLKEINEIKSEVFRQKCAEKLKLSKINNIKKSLIEKEMTQLKNAENLEKAIQSHYQVQNKGDHDLKSFYSEKHLNPNNNNHINQDYLCEADSFIQNNNYKNLSKSKHTSANRSIEKISDGEINHKKNLKIVNENEKANRMNHREASRSKSKGRLSPNSKNENTLISNNAVNIFEINKRFKSPLNLNSSEMVIAQSENKAELSLIINDLNNTNNLNLKESFKNMIDKNSKISLQNNLYPNVELESEKRIKLRNENYNRHESPETQRMSEINQKNENDRNFLVTSQNLPNMIVTPNNASITLKMSPSSRFVKNLNTMKNAQFSNNPIMVECQSIRISENIPLTLIEFGKYLVKHIENEENYKILYEKEFKKIKLSIQKTFQNEKLSDHCLLDYMLELWDKLEISFEKRYKIIFELSKK